jgi:AcrR family transcriptional regulator
MNEKDSTKEKIVKIAQELFAEKGYDAVGVAEICLSAHISKGSFYYHFESKEVLFLTLLENWLESVDQKLKTISEQNFSWEDGIQYILVFLKELAWETARQNIIFLEFYSKAIRNQKIWHRLDLEMQKYQYLLAQLIQKGIEQKMLKPIDANLTAKSTIAFIIGLLMEGWLTKEEEDIDSFLNHSLQIFLKGIQL